MPTDGQHFEVASNLRKVSGIYPGGVQRGVSDKHEDVCFRPIPMDDKGQEQGRLVFRSPSLGAEDLHIRLFDRWVAYEDTVEQAGFALPPLCQA